MYQTNFIPQGWECPKCKRVYSPITQMCSHCPEHTQGYATTGTNLTNISSVTMSGHDFQPEKKGSSATKCKICGLEKFQHPNSSHT